MNNNFDDVPDLDDFTETISKIKEKEKVPS